MFEMPKVVFLSQIDTLTLQLYQCTSHQSEQYLILMINQGRSPIRVKSCLFQVLWSQKLRRFLYLRKLLLLSDTQSL